MKVHSYTTLFKDYFTLCKPKVVAVMLVTAWVGMQLASRETVPWHILIYGILGIALSGGAAAVINQLIDRKRDALMLRTAWRPLAEGRLSPMAAIIFASILASMGLIILAMFVNTLTAILSLLTILGYTVLYSLLLKQATPQNIVIGGISGAMPPLLGWTATTGELSAYALLPVLIIFIWTPPHFWSLAIYRRSEYQKAKVPMLPITHGVPYTKLCILLYTLLLIPVTLLPYATGMSGELYFFSALLLGISFLIQTIILFFSHCDKTALKTFSFSILYLLLLFLALLIDHLRY